MLSWSRVSKASNLTPPITPTENAAQSCIFVNLVLQELNLLLWMLKLRHHLIYLHSSPAPILAVQFPLSSAIWLPQRLRHHFCNGAAGICSRLVLCRQATAEERMSHSGAQCNLKAWRSGSSGSSGSSSGGVEWQPRQPGAGNLSSASVFNL